MFIKLLSLVVMLLVATVNDANARGGGHLTTFDPNLFDGNWTCFMSAASGKCGGATSHYFNAACDGVTDDSAAFAAVATYGIAHNPTPLNLLAPFGVTCYVPSAGAFGGQANSNFTLTAGIDIFRFWSYGATLIGSAQWELGTDGIFCECAIGSATSLINTANAGDTTVTMIPTPLSLWPISLSNGNLTITATGNQSGSSNPTNVQMGFSSASNTSGKFYFEGKLVAKGAGVETTFVGITDQIKYSYFYIDDFGNIFERLGNPSPVFKTGLGHLTAGSSFVGVAVDFPDKLIWFTTDGIGWNGSGSSNPANGASDCCGYDISGMNLVMPIYAMATVSSSSDSWTMNFGGSSFNFTKPIGYSNWTGTISTTLPGPYIVPNLSWININSCAVQIESSVPPNWCNQEYHIVTAVNGNTLTLNGPLANTYLSTTPSLLIQGFNDSQGDNAGPANIMVMTGSWNVSQAYYGGTYIPVNTTGDNRVLTIGKNITVQDALIYGWSASSSVSDSLFNSTVHGTEVDKNITTLTFSNVACQNNLFFQSPSPAKFFGYNLYCNMNGTGPDVSLYGGFGAVNVGPIDFGITKSLYVDGFNVISAKSNPCGPCVNISDLSFSAGVLSANNNSLGFDTAMAGMQIPGSKWYFGDTDGSDDSSPHSYFTISASTQDATNTHFIMSNCSWGSCSGALPTPACGSNPSCTVFAPFGALSVTQINKPPGSVDLTQFQAP